MDGFYIAPAFMDKLVVHISKNFMKLPNIKVQFNRKIDLLFGSFIAGFGYFFCLLIDLIILL